MANSREAPGLARHMAAFVVLLHGTFVVLLHGAFVARMRAAFTARRPDAQIGPVTRVFAHRLASGLVA